MRPPTPACPARATRGRRPARPLEAPRQACHLSLPPPSLARSIRGRRPEGARRRRHGRSQGTAEPKEPRSDEPVTGRYNRWSNPLVRIAPAWMAPARSGRAQPRRDSPGSAVAGPPRTAWNLNDSDVSRSTVTPSPLHTHTHTPHTPHGLAAGPGHHDPGLTDRRAGAH